MNNQQAKYRATLVDAAKLRANVNCRAACPVHTDAQAYIEAIAHGDFDKAYRIASAPNPFVNVCALICGHPCEQACRRGKHDEPVSIRGLKRAAMAYVSSGPAMGGDIPQSARQNKKVAVIGGGPGGITAAHDLNRLGYDVTLFEGSSKLGGMLGLGIPEYRLPRDVLATEINRLVEGIEIKLNTKIGEHVSFSDLRQEFPAIFLAVGAQKGRQLNIEGVEADGVVNGIDFLLNVNLGYKVEVGKKVVVIGGGNVAIDVARTAAREAGIEFAGDKSYEAALYVARAAMRTGAPEVHLVCLESELEMPAYDEEITETLKEGIHIHNSRGPTKVVCKDGKCVGLQTVKCLRVFDEDGKFSPQFEPGSEEVLDCGTVMLAIGQHPDLSFLGPDIRLDMTPGGFVKANPVTMGTNVPCLYVGGDVAFGTRTAIEGIADGRRAAMAIHHELSGKVADKTADSRPKVIKLRTHHMVEGFDRAARHEIPTTPLNRRTGISEVEIGFSREEAIAEAQRCLLCNRAPMVDSTKCVLCGGCVDICPYECLKIVAVERVKGDEKVLKFAEVKYGISMQQMNEDPDGDRWYVMLKDDEKCTRCALCVERCPVGAMWMGQLQEEVNGTTVK